ncbi:MAG: ATP-binding protein [Nitrososphaerota archaeon]|nr:ATP-binding protein [Nitrososphaerota archaeon]
MATRDQEVVTNPNLIDAEPTKDFFISMLVRDVELQHAIVDLVDNCLDGARRIRSRGNYDGLFVRVEAGSDQFRIQDNCGGIDVDNARNYAFRFGRAPGMKVVKHSVGEFGVGMKRALFKLGSKFRIESTCSNSRFVVEVDVDEWREEKEWQFEFKDLKEDLPSVPPDQRGTTITVTDLHDGVKEAFKLENSLSIIRNEIQKKHEQSVLSRLAISFNGLPIEASPVGLLSSKDLRAAYDAFTDSDGRVAVKVYAGIAGSSPQDGGWYVYCNGRMILGADQTTTTGWGEMAAEQVPRYHNQFARFRGYVFFDSDDAYRLPWNTTKSGMDKDSLVYQGVRLKMVSMMRPVIDFLNGLDGEKDYGRGKPRPLEALVRNAKWATLDKVKHARAFAWTYAEKKEEPETRISYTRPKDEVSQAMRSLKVSTPREVGERTFDYYYERECE